MRPSIGRQHNHPYPAWWEEWPELHWQTAEERQQAKVLAAQQLLGTAMNLTGEHATHQRIADWTEPHDYPGVLLTVAEAVLVREWDADVAGLTLRLVNAGYGARIRNGVLLSDMYWNCNVAGWEYAALTLLTVRSDEVRLADAMAVVGRLGGSS